MLKQVQHDGLPGAVWQDELSMTVGGSSLEPFGRTPALKT
jgi:hypothetical protein